MQPHDDALACFVEKFSMLACDCCETASLISKLDPAFMVVAQAQNRSVLQLIGTAEPLVAIR